MPKLSEETMKARRQHIVDAAARCFADRGYRATSIPDICEAAGVSVGAVYTHFDSKEGIVEAMAEASARDKVQAFSSDDPQHTLQSADYLLDLVRAIFQADGRETARLDLDLWAESTRNPRLRSSIVDSFAQMAVQLERVTKRSQAAAELDSALPARGVAHVLLAIGLGLEVQRALDLECKPRSVQRALRGLLSGAWTDEPA